MDILFPIIVIAIAGLIAYWGGSIGFFSSLLHLAVVVVSGAIAFAAWEPLAMFMASKMPIAFVDMSWGISLIVVFALSMAILETVANKACPANVRVSDSVNFIGGVTVGAFSGSITAGILVIGLQFIQGPTEIMYYRGWRIDTEGSIAHEDKLILPVDEITEWIYEKGSLSTMSVPDPLAQWQPNVAQAASLYRESYNEGASRMGLRPGEVKVDRIVKIDYNDPPEIVSRLRGAQDPYTFQPARDGDFYLINTRVNFGAADGGERVRLTKAQVRLVVRDLQGKFVAVHPHAFVHRFATDLAENSRWAFDSGDLPAVSVGAGGEPEMAFEFLVPRGATPSHLLVRNVLTELPREAPEAMTPGQVQQAFSVTLQDDQGLPLPYPGFENRITYPSAGAPDKPRHWQGLGISAILFGFTMFLSMRPTKRTHQD